MGLSYYPRAGFIVTRHLNGFHPWLPAPASPLAAAFARSSLGVLIRHPQNSDRHPLLRLVHCFFSASINSRPVLFVEALKLPPFVHKPGRCARSGPTDSEMIKERSCLGGNNDCR
jgi:hypothetical protein